MTLLTVAYDARPLKPRTRHYGPGVFLENILRRLAGDLRLVGLAQNFVDSRQWSIRTWPSIPRLNSIFFEVSPLLERCAQVYWGTIGFLPQVLKIPSVATVHDLLFLNNMDGQRFVKFFGWRLSSSLRHAHRVIAVSGTTADDLLARFPELKGKVEVALQGFESPSPTPNGDAAREGLTGAPYVMMLGAHAPRKNLGLALAATARLIDQGIGMRLLITSDIHPSFRDLLRRQPEYVQTLGVLRREKLFRLLSGASALFFPSRYEGFGFPLLEAMAAGCPVLALDTPINREIGGGAAWLLPEDALEWAKASKALMTSPSLRSEMRGKGFENLSRFSWDRTAAIYDQVFREVAR